MLKWRIALSAHRSAADSTYEVSAEQPKHRILSLSLPSKCFTSTTCCCCGHRHSRKIVWCQHLKRAVWSLSLQKDCLVSAPQATSSGFIDMHFKCFCVGALSTHHSLCWLRMCDALAQNGPTWPTLWNSNRVKHFGHSSFPVFCALMTKGKAAVIFLSETTPSAEQF